MFELDPLISEQNKTSVPLITLLLLLLSCKLIFKGSNIRMKFDEEKQEKKASVQLDARNIIDNLKLHLYSIEPAWLIIIIRA